MVQISGYPSHKLVTGVWKVSETMGQHILMECPPAKDFYLGLIALGKPGVAGVSNPLVLDWNWMVWNETNRSALLI